MADSDSKLFFWLLILAAIAAAGWYFRDVLQQPPEVLVAPEPAVELVTPAAEASPRHPISVPRIAIDDNRAAVQLPPLDDSDAYFLLDIATIFGADVEALLLRDNIIDRLVATVDNLPRQQVPRKIRPVQTLATPFIDGAENYQRYDALVAYIAAADLDAMVDMYQRYYPLFQKSFEQLGYPNAYFNDRLVEVIDHLLETPELVGPLMLVRPNVLYEFADPELENLSSGQKLLLRVGNDHAATIMQVLRQLRTRIADRN
jgi:hypothetical protein